jgi:hypothetical protein
MSVSKKWFTGNRMVVVAAKNQPAVNMGVLKAFPKGIATKSLDFNVMGDIDLRER